MTEEYIKDVEVEAGDEHLAIRNPEHSIKTYLVSLVDDSTGELHENLYTHHYSMEECERWVGDNTPMHLRCVRIIQPDTNQMKLIKIKMENK